MYRFKRKIHGNRELIEGWHIGTKKSEVSEANEAQCRLLLPAVAVRAVAVPRPCELSERSEGKRVDAMSRFKRKIHGNRELIVGWHIGTKKSEVSEANEAQCRLLLPAVAVRAVAVSSPSELSERSEGKRENKSRGLIWNAENDFDKVRWR
jgi:hypothetical protein